MVSFRLYYNLNKHTSDYDSIFGLRPASWAVAVIGSLVRMNIYGIVNIDDERGHYLESYPV
jgi:hypothetical protein